jgi:hypothetical protein
MQHLDEGTIHSWLDGALSADEAAQTEAHVKECAQCATAVAEARGFIAASSRILTSLDNVPKGVVPVARRRRVRNWPIWRAAAAVLVVALGSFVVLRDRVVPTARTSSAKAIVSDAVGTSIAAAPGAVITEQTASDSSVRNAAPMRRSERSQESVAKRAPSAIGIGRGRSTPQPQPSSAIAPQFQKTMQAPAGTRGDVRDNFAAPSAIGTAGAAAPVRSALSAQVPDIATASAVNEPQLLRVVGRQRTIGQTQTRYEVAPGDTVSLTEVSNLRLENVVVTGATAAAPRVDTSPSDQSRLRAQAKAPASRDNSRKTEPQPSAPAAPPAAPSVETSNGITTLRWTDAATGNTMKLSGRHTLVELLEIKRRIEQARAVEAAKKKP